MTTPGVVADTSGFGLVSIRGISTVLNNVEIDGADDNDAYYSEERGRTREAYSTSGSAVREFAVNTGVYSAEYGRAAGGVITSVTKSGGNQIHGQAYFWDRESNWNAFNDYTQVAVYNSTNNTYPLTHIKPEDLRKIYGFTVGGPLIKDKLFWIYTYDQHTHVFPAEAIANNATAFYTLPNATTSGTCNLSTGYLTGDNPTRLDADACTLAARQGLTSYGAGCYFIRHLDRQPELRPRHRAALRIPGNQHPQARLANQFQGALERPGSSLALGFAGWRSDLDRR